MGGTAVGHGVTAGRAGVVRVQVGGVRVAQTIDIVDGKRTHLSVSCNQICSGFDMFQCNIIVEHQHK